MKRIVLAAFLFFCAAIACADYRMIVRLRPGATRTDAVEAATWLGGSVADEAPGSPFLLFALPDDPATLTLAQMAMALGFIDVVWSGDDTTLWSAESVSRGSTLSVIGDRSSVVSYNANYLSQVGWNSGLANADGRTVRVAILDNGLARTQPTLWAKVDAWLDVFHGNADDTPMRRDSNGNGTFDDGVGHGTMVAGLVDTIAPKVRFVVAKVADSDGRASAWGIVKGIAFAVANNCEVANVSLGSEEPVPAYNAAASWARGRGLLIVAAIGNAGVSHAWYPAKDAGTLCVTGLDQADLKASFSNYDFIAVSAAPSKDLVSQYYDGGLASWSGTSFAAPFVTAAIADCLRRTTVKTPDFLLSAVVQTGRSVDGINLSYAGRLGKVLNIMALNARITGPSP